MFRPERMSRVSVTGSKTVMHDVIETVHDLDLLHVTEYDGTWEGFDPGNPIAGADTASDKLVTVRSLQSILGIEDENGPKNRIVTDAELEEELETVRTDVNELDQQRDEVRDELRSIDEQLDIVEPVASLGIDLDLLSGYDELAVAIGTGNPEAVESALAEADGVQAFDVFSGGETVAAFAYPGGVSLEDEFVGIEFTALEVPQIAAGSDRDGVTPEAHVSDLEDRREQLESRLETIESQLGDLRLEVADFLLAAEEKLAIDAQKREAPLAFATTENAFIAEGWLPTGRYDDLVARLESSVGDRVDIEELERADYDAQGQVEHTESVEETATDGGTDVAMSDTGPPVVQDNPDPFRPFELLVRTVSRPRYSELDPTVLVWLTFPTFFGFMIGDVGYGIFYVLVGYLMFSRLESPGLKALGGVAIWAGVFTIIFGILYGEVFGFHVLGDWLWGGHPPIEKGLSEIEFALLWLFTVAIIGLLHVGIGYVLGFINTARHSVVDAVLESGSWFVLMFGVWIWVFSRSLAETKPDFVFHVLDSGEEAVFALGFGGFSESVGIAALGAALVGLVLMIYDEYRHIGAAALIVGPLESLQVLVNILSYARITAVLLAKAGMAFVVNLLTFGLTHDGHFAVTHGAEEGLGLLHQGPIAVLGGLVILVIGHATVWALGITSAGLQAIRLEYVEFFQKFYEGGGETYEPFGYERQYTAAD